MPRERDLTSLRSLCRAALLLAGAGALLGLLFAEGATWPDRAPDLAVRLALLGAVATYLLAVGLVANTRHAGVFAGLAVAGAFPLAYAGLYAVPGAGLLFGAGLLALGRDLRAAGPEAGPGEAAGTGA